MVELLGPLIVEAGQKVLCRSYYGPYAGLLSFGAHSPC